MDGEVADELAPLTSNSGSERHTASDPQRGQAEEGTESTLFADNKRKLGTDAYGAIHALYHNEVSL
jgi:hypothetical protein